MQASPFPLRPLRPLRRRCGAMLASAVTTALLLIVMQSLINGPGAVPEAAPPVRITEYLPVLENVAPEPAPPPEPPAPPESPPPAPLDLLIDGPGVGTAIVMLPPPLEAVRVNARSSVPDGDILPVFKVAPAYPRAAAQRQLEGYVVVRFTVDEAGRVVDPEVVEAQPRGVFERSALDAVQRFKYRPRVVNGQPVRVHGVLHRLTYEMSRA